MTDPIADFLTRIRNAIMAKHKVVEIPASNLKKEMTKVLYDKGYILNFKFIDDNKRNIEASNTYGFHGIHFKSSEKLIQQLKTYNIYI